MTKCVVGGSMFKEYRKRLGLTQEEFAEMVDLSTRQLQRIEKNEINTSIETLLKIKNALHMTDEDFIKLLKKYEKTAIPS